LIDCSPGSGKTNFTRFSSRQLYNQVRGARPTCGPSEGLPTILEVLSFTKIASMTRPHLSRRELLLYSSMTTLPWAGGVRSAVAGSSHSHERASSPSRYGIRQFFTEEDAADVESITALILPEDETPGARKPGVIHFIDRALATFDLGEASDLSCWSY
jgi:hypothetical protein